MRVLYLVPPGRSADRLTPYTFLDEEIEGLARANIRPWVLSNTDHPDTRHGPIQVRAVHRGRWKERARVPGMMTQYSDALSMGSPMAMRKAFHLLRMELSAANVVRAEAIDVVHSHFGCAYGLGGLVAARETHRPLVASFRGMDILVEPSMDYGLRRDPNFDKGVRALLRQADMTTYATDFMRETAIRMGAREETAVTIRKGVDLERFSVSRDRLALRESLGLGRPTILTVATLIPRKGIDVILKALARLRGSHDFDFVICGKGPEEIPLRRMARRFGLEDRTHFLGWVSRDEVSDYFAASDMFILASHLEAAGNVLLEAMSAGRPVISTDSGGPPEYVQDGVSGFTVPVGDDAAMSAKIQAILDDPAMGDSLGRAGRAIAERDHRYERMIAEYVEVYRRARQAGREASPPLTLSAPSRQASDAAEDLGPLENGKRLSDVPVSEQRSRKGTA